MTPSGVSTRVWPGGGPECKCHPSCQLCVDPVLCPASASLHGACLEGRLCPSLPLLAQPRGVIATEFELNSVDRAWPLSTSGSGQDKRADFKEHTFSGPSVEKGHLGLGQSPKFELRAGAGGQVLRCPWPAGGRRALPRS